jgi:lipopolysaccharide biosynthesis glycosyltransferase
VNKLIVTRADDNIKEMTDITFPTIKEYAKKCGADFKVLSHTPDVNTYDNKPHYRILEVYNLFEEYDRILCLDCDMLVLKECPNIFNIVPEDMIGSIYEDKATRKVDRLGRIRHIQSIFGDIGWRENYTNAGTFILSKQHRDIFLPVDGKYWNQKGSVDVHLSYNIHKYDFKVYELEYKWNHMTMFSETWNNNADRFNSYIIHYAGGGIFNNNISSKIEQIRNDYKKIYQNG